MPIKIVNYAGRFGWNMRKYLPKLASVGYLNLQYITRRGGQKKYIDWFMSQETTPYPKVVNLETINRCNNTCAFCTANRNAEKRPFKKMDEALFKSIILQLKEWGYKGRLTLHGNNEPFLDTRIVEWHRFAREQLPDVHIFLSTNGILLNIEKLEEICPYIDELIINNYCKDMKLFDNIREIYDYVKANEEKFRNVDMRIQMRYIEEVLTNRAGSAPNKQGTKKIIKETCLMPYTDMWIVPDGRMGICCCDNFEVTTLADLNETSLKEAWSNENYRELREKVRGGRHNYDFCKYCDFIDAGLRAEITEEP